METCGVFFPFAEVCEGITLPAGEKEYHDATTFIVQIDTKCSETFCYLDAKLI
jgi:hypothetical protein